MYTSFILLLLFRGLCRCDENPNLKIYTHTRVYEGDTNHIHFFPLPNMLEDEKAFTLKRRKRLQSVEENERHRGRRLKCYFTFSIFDARPG